MNRFLYIIVLGCFCLHTPLLAQKKANDGLIVIDTNAVKKIVINPLAPSKAAFYSAIFPGMGQAYNKKYWKMPLVYGALGTTIYFFVNNNKKYNQYRDAYKRRLEGYTDDNFRYLDDSRLISAQKFYQKNRDLSALLTGLFYILNIVDANVDAHLSQFNVSDKLTLEPDVLRNDLTYSRNLGFKLSYNF